MKYSYNYLCKLTSTLLITLFLHPPIMFAQLADLDEANAIIEYDSLYIYSSAVKAEFIQLHFKRNYRVRIQTETGANDFKNITLPEWHDPWLYFHAPKQHNAGKHLGGVIVDHFSATIIKPDGKIIAQEIIPEYEKVRFVSLRNQRYEDADNYKYHLKDLKPGDVLEINYNYSAKYDENFFSLITFRIFFHGKYPVLQKDLVFSHPKVLEVEVTTENTDNPLIQYDKETAYSWHLENLPACMAESSIRPYLDLPYVIFSLLPNEMLYTVPYSFDERFIPFYVFGPSVREKNHLEIVRAFLNGVNTKDYNYIRRYIKARTEDLPADTTGFSSLYSVHNYIAENFSYYFDEEEYLYDQTRKSRMGEHLAEGKIYDRSRYDIYVGLISGLGMRYFTAYLADNRSGIISNEYFEPTVSSDYIFAVLLAGGEVQFLYPKKERFGYYLNELPFYFENNTARLIYLDDFRYYKEAIQEDFRSVTTPVSSYSDNVRQQSAKVDVDVNERKVKVEAAITLSGQFSTLGRGAYLFGNCDPTVNPAYCERFGENFATSIDQNTYQITEVKKDFPFKAEIHADFNADQALSFDGDTLILDFSGWFSHITDANLNAENRLLPYYPDFMYSDTYNYQVNFNRDVEILDPLPFARIENKYGGLIIGGHQKPDGSLLIMSKLIVASEKVTTEDIKDVNVIQQNIRELNKLKIRMLLK